MKKNLFARVLSLVLILALLPCWSSFAWADSPVIADGAEENRASVDVTSNNNITAEAVVAKDGGTANIGDDDHPGNVTATNTGGASGGGAIGVSANESSGGTSVVNVSGDVTASTNSSNTENQGNSIGVYSSGYIGSAEVSVSGDVSATAETGSSTGNAIGVSSVVGMSGNDSSSTVTVDGNISALTEGSGDAYGISASDMTNGTTDITTGDVEARATGSGDAVGVRASNNFGPVTIDVGDVEAENDGSGSATGLNIAAAGGTFNVTAENVEAEAEQNNSVDPDADSTGIKVTADHSGTNVNITAEEVCSEAETGTAYGIDASSQGGANVSVTVNGPITVTGAEYASGVNLSASENGTTSLNLNDSLTSESENGAGNGMYIYAKTDGTVEVVVDGDIDADGVGINTVNSTGLVDVDVTGDVEGSRIGIGVDGDGQTTFVIDGTVHGEEVGIKLGVTTTGDNLDITVWQIDTTKIDGEDHVVGAHDGTGLGTTTASKKVESNINYIIKINPSQKDNISVSGTTNKDGYETAKEGDKVVMKVNVPSGYKLTGAYSDTGEQLSLKQDSDGNYYVIVPRGGGVYLSAKWEKVPEETQEDDDSSQDVSPASYNSYDDSLYVGSAAIGYCTVTFELNGGHTISGNPGPIIRTVPASTWLRLLDAPSMDDASFELWYTEDDTVTVNQPYESFEVKHDITFIAKWEGIEIPYSPSEEETALVDSFSSVGILPYVVEEMPEESSSTVASVDPVNEETSETVDQAAKEADPIAELAEKAADDVVSDTDDKIIKDDTTSPVDEKPEEADNPAIDELPISEDVTEEMVEEASSNAGYAVIPGNVQISDSEEHPLSAESASGEAKLPEESPEEAVEEEPSDIGTLDLSEDEQLPAGDEMDVSIESPEIQSEQATESTASDHADEVEAKDTSTAKESAEITESQIQDSTLQTVSLSDLCGEGEGLNLKAKLVIDLGNGSTMELPVNINITLGDITF